MGDTSVAAADAPQPSERRHPSRPRAAGARRTEGGPRRCPSSREPARHCRCPQARRRPALRRGPASARGSDDVRARIRLNGAGRRHAAAVSLLSSCAEPVGDGHTHPSRGRWPDDEGDRRRVPCPRGDEATAQAGGNSCPATEPVAYLRPKGPKLPSSSPGSEVSSPS